MLSRIAESLYWIGRYIERAEDTARLLDVHYHLLLEDRRADEAVGVPRAARRDGRRRPTRSAPSPTPPRSPRSSRRTSPSRGRSRARSARRGRTPAARARRISSELWETLNTTHREVGAPGARGGGPGAPRLLRLGARPRRRVQRDRRRHHEPRRRLAVPRARAQPRARRHDRPPAVGAVRRRLRPHRVDDDPAELLGVRGVPAHLPARGRRVVGGRVPAARPAVPALGVPRAHHRGATGSASSTRARRGRASTTRPAARSGALRAELEFLRVDEAIDDLPALLARLQQRLRRGARRGRAPLLPGDPRHRVERVSVIVARCGSGTPRRSATPTWCTRRTTRRASRRSTRRASSRSNTASTSIPRPTCSATATTGEPACTRSTSTARTASSRWSARRWSRRRTARPTSTRRVAWDAHRRAGPHRPPVRVPGGDADDRGRRRDPSRSPTACAASARPATRWPSSATWIRDHVEYEPGTTDVSTTAAEVLAARRGVCQDFAHLGARGAAGGRDPGPLRVGLPLSRRPRA